MAIQEDNNMAGFFNLEEPKKINKKKKNIKKVSLCESCKAYMSCKNGKMGVVGNGDKKILIIGDAVSRREDEEGTPFTDMASAYLREELSNIGIDMERDCWLVNSIQCYSGKITPAMVGGCRPRLEKVIYDLNPEKILLLGDEAVNIFLGERLENSRAGSGQIEKWMDSIIPDQKYKAMVVVNYHPKFVLSALSERKKLMKKWGNYREVKNKPLWKQKRLLDDDNFRIRSLYFKKYLRQILTDKEYIHEDFEGLCSYTPHIDEALNIMRLMMKEKLVAWDIETNTLQPYGSDSKILMISFSNGVVSYSFPFFSEDKRFMRVFKSLMSNENIKFIIANAQFEENYVRAKTGISTIEGCYWDTVLAAHILNPTVSGNTGLKVCAYKTTGVIGYDSSVETKIKGRDEKNPYSLNRLDEVYEHELGLYNAMDSLLTHRVAVEQMSIIENDSKLNSVFRLYMRGQVVFADMSFHGFMVDEEQLIKNEIELEKKLVEIEYELKNTDEVKSWYKEYPNDEFNFKSNDQLSKLFFNILKYDTGKVTLSGAKSIDKDVLEEFSKTSKLAELLVEYKKTFKLLNTDLKGLRNNTCDGKIHPFYGLSQASTGRSNSSRMNFQNLNTTDPYAVEMIRGCLKAPKGQEIVMFDYHALEIFGAIAHHHDPMWIAEQAPPDGVEALDAHTAMAETVFKEDLSKVARFCIKEKDGNSDPTEDEIKHFIKNELRKPCKNISFALAYGGSANRVFQTLWNENLKPYHKAWFKSIKLGTEEKFREHSKQIFEFYWDRYKVFGEWRDKVWEQYLSNGYIYNKFGFRLNGINSKTFITNAPIQGASYAVCLLANIKLWETMKKKGYQSKIVAAIHDSLEVLYDPKEMFEGGLYEDIKYCMEDYVNTKVRWLTLPLSVEGEWFLDNWATEVKEDEVRKKYEYPKNA